jgi:hypothetical protein
MIFAFLTIQNIKENSYLHAKFPNFGGFVKVTANEKCMSGLGLETAKLSQVIIFIKST